MPDQTEELIQNFLGGSPFAVVGASTNRKKYGNKVLRCYLQNDRIAYPINPRAEEIEGVTCSPDLESVSEPVHGVSIITPPKISAKILREAVELGIQHFWLQPGAEDEGVYAVAEELGIDIIAGGPCLLVRLGYSEREQ